MSQPPACGRLAMEETLVQSKSLKHEPRQLPTGKMYRAGPSSALAAIALALMVLA